MCRPVNKVRKGYVGCDEQVEFSNMSSDETLRTEKREFQRVGAVKTESSVSEDTESGGE